MSPFVRETFARICASRKFGTAMAARMAMMATTISSSISVKARGVSVLGVHCLLWYLASTRRMAPDRTAGAGDSGELWAHSSARVDRLSKPRGCRQVHLCVERGEDVGVVVGLATVD